MTTDGFKPNTLGRKPRKRRTTHKSPGTADDVAFLPGAKFANGQRAGLLRQQPRPRGS